MDFSELSHQREIRESLNKIFSEKCSPEKLKNFDNEFKHDENLYEFLATNGYLGLGINEKLSGDVRVIEVGIIVSNISDLIK